MAVLALSALWCTEAVSSSTAEDIRAAAFSSCLILSLRLLSAVTSFQHAAYPTTSPDVERRTWTLVWSVYLPRGMSILWVLLVRAISSRMRFMRSGSLWYLWILPPIIESTSMFSSSLRFFFIS